MPLATSPSIRSNVMALLLLKLSKDNYLLWKISHFYYRGLSFPSTTIVDTTGTIITNSDFLSWQKNDQLVLMWIISSLTKAIYPHLVGHTTAKVACDALARLFASRAKSRILELHAKLHNTRRGSASIQEHVQNINMIQTS
ncbi:unnamed protein product [Spirodela intermedia]|uniref:Uncharacterized protein n=1 Tax=Spirodela intermedia TaxID=51605 RepID=A0A7I8IDC6_SPIIN|nr:unnamed protein product [Spirodela intermedia]CAA6655798.1 unnamed protein product [Spirodela intermedia]